MPVNNNSEDKSCSSPHGRQQHKNDSAKAKANGNKDVVSKKPIRKSQAKQQSQEVAITKTEKDSVRSVTTTSTEAVSGINQDAKAGIGSYEEECQDPPVVDISEYQNDLAQSGAALVLNTSTPEIVSYEVAVGV